MAMSGEPNPVLATERRRRVVQALRRDGVIRVAELARQLGVSASTVRRDLTALQRSGLVMRVHGGAARSAHRASASTVAANGKDASKHVIARAAARLVEDGMRIMLLSGATVGAMCEFLAGKDDLTIVTNNLDTAHVLAHSGAGHAVVVLGGLVHSEQKTLIGAMAEDNLQAVHVDIMFGGAWGVDGTGATGMKMLMAAPHDRLLDRTTSLVVLAEAVKLGRRGPALLARPDQIERVITDHAAPTHTVKELRAAGLHIDVCR